MQHELDGALSTADQERLAAFAASSEATRTERAQYAALGSLLQSEKISAPAGFVDSVLARIESSARSRWFWWVSAVAAALVLTVGGSTLFSGSTEGSGVLAALSALGGFVSTVALAGAGLLGATWSGVGSIARQWFADSPATMVLAVAAAVGANALLIRTLSRRRRARERSR